MIRKIRTYLKNAYTELVNKVSWPTWKELQSSALLVMLASLIFAIVIFAMDITLENIMKFIYSIKNL
ncbi:MAG: preprotein translocase subunit SecE [Prevotellaceae bacterium]|jgi:preprotein translocase subunit SecE|nr:preprotein translocase subunit SecE [Prevotellaceae bacterium]